MTTYRFRVRFKYDPASLWRDIVVGTDCTLDEFQTVLILPVIKPRTNFDPRGVEYFYEFMTGSMNRAVGLNQDHLWFFGIDQDYWDSDVQYKRPGEIEQSVGGLTRGGEEYDAGETTVDQMARQLDLEEYDRICYLFDYGDEWRFYSILKEIDEDEPSDKAPEVVKEKGEPVEQYGRPG